MRLLTLLVLVLGCSMAAAAASCRYSRSRSSCDGDDSSENSCMDCKPSCDCEQENCDTCPGTNKCCQNCCARRRCTAGSRCDQAPRCDCRSVSCSSCSVASNDCCDSCCKCQPKKCEQQQQCGCNDVTCGASCKGSCCNSCCDKPAPTPAPAPIIIPAPDRIVSMPNITLPNITIIINQSPIYVNTTPIVNNYQSCGNYSSVNNGSHVIYVSSNTTSPGCGNRTCCRVPIPQPCMPQPMPPHVVCPPPVYNWRCGAPCFNPPPPPPPPPCYNIPTWPYLRCPTQNCYGYGCYPQNTGCVQVPSWPFFRCGSGGSQPGPVPIVPYDNSGPIEPALVAEPANIPNLPNFAYPGPAYPQQAGYGYPGPVFGVPPGNVGNFQGYPPMNYGAPYGPQGP